jgi:hypothetical protein
LVAGGGGGSLVIGSVPLGTFLSTGKATKLGNREGEHRQQEEHSQQSHNDVLAVPHHCNWQNKATWYATTTLQVSTSLVYVVIGEAVHEFYGVSPCRNKKYLFFWIYEGL